jgi:hypothetical protein
MTTKNKVLVSIGLIVILILVFVWLRWGAKTWEVQITGVTGDGANIVYRIETVLAGTTDTLIFRNEDTGVMPPYFKYDSARLQSIARRVSDECPRTPVEIHGYGFRIPMLSMFPNALSIDAPERCLGAPSRGR